MLDARRNPLFNHVIIADGCIIGTWKPVTKKKVVRAETNLFVTLDDDMARVLSDATERYNSFMNPPAAQA
jgi:hypothetical protein